MPRSFDFERTGITVADADPNPTPPVAATIMNLGEQRTDQSGVVANGVTYYLVFDGGASPTADVTIWARDASQSAPDVWASVQTDLGVANRELFEALGLGSADIFLQITNITGAPTSIIVRAEPTI